MESQKIKNLSDHKENTYPKYQTKRWYIINDQNNGQYGEGNNNDDTVKIDTDVVKPFLCDYADAYILVTGNITVENVATAYINNTKVAFKNCHPFIEGKVHLNDTNVDESDNLYLIMNMYNLIELKTEVDKLDIPKLKTVPIDLADLSKEVQEDFTKKTYFNSLKTKVDKNETVDDNLESIVNKNDISIKTIVNNLKTKVDDIDVSKYVLKSVCDNKMENLESNIPDISGKLNTSGFDSKVNELENKIKTAENKPAQK